MTIAQRIIYVAAGSHFTAALIRDGAEWRTFFYGSFAIGAIAGSWMLIDRLRGRSKPIATD
ncbi:hypothetical protein GRI97_07855 [Altererythrobacter xixiisoli]|uniref:Uncharacterized protein n=1 Tax=Croceibacterium xixiisoli TaxID=1476466 RepID=A0A6I4TUG3_9SPHN|nr:hypothetical protein [Croceibacterium xixiisoli]MXO98899.1 hypothetical protein [Croceibacterium xixiisoli]